MFAIGVDYYPEQWPEKRWAQDAELMAAAGFNTVRLAEFAWSRLEPREGAFELAWLERAIDLLRSRGMSVVLGTPTASPPPWLMQGHPELFRVQEDGREVTFGNRREYCPSNPAYRTHCRRIVTAMAERFGRHPAVVGWQIDNEMGDRCYCSSCRAAFQAWLRSRHGSLDELNARWGTAFWSHTYSAWEQIPLAPSTGGAPNPGLALDFRRFVSELYAELQREQIMVVRSRSPDRFVTHNHMGFGYEGLDYQILSKDLDFVSWDNYPLTQWHAPGAVDPTAAALSHAAMRGLKAGRPFWVMEQQAGAAGWDVVGVPPRPGELALWAWQSVAHGADGVLFFRWRTARFGTEQYWHGLLDHDGSTGRRYAEVADMARSASAIGELISGSRYRAEVAMVLSADSRLSLRIQPTNPGLEYGRVFREIHRAFCRANVAVDVLGPGEDLSPYRLVVAPLLAVVRPQDAERLTFFVSQGGHLVLTFRSGSRDQHNAVVDARLPGLLRELCGLEIEEYDSLPPGSKVRLRFLPPALRRIPGELQTSWCDVLRLTDAEPLALYGSGHYRGRPAAAVRRMGSGRVVYVGVEAGSAIWEGLCTWLRAGAGVEPVLRAPPQVEVTERRQGEQRLLFLLNHGERARTVRMDAAAVEPLGGSRVVRRRLRLEPKGVRVLVVTATPGSRGP